MVNFGPLPAEIGLLVSDAEPQIQSVICIVGWELYVPWLAVKAVTYCVTVVTRNVGQCPT